MDEKRAQAPEGTIMQEVERVAALLHWYQEGLGQMLAALGVSQQDSVTEEDFSKALQLIGKLRETGHSMGLLAKDLSVDPNNMEIIFEKVGALKMEAEHERTQAYMLHEQLVAIEKALDDSLKTPVAVQEFQFEPVPELAQTRRWSDSNPMVLPSLPDRVAKMAFDLENAENALASCSKRDENAESRARELENALRSSHTENQLLRDEFGTLRKALDGQIGRANALEENLDRSKVEYEKLSDTTQALRFDQSTELQALMTRTAELQRATQAAEQAVLPLQDALTDAGQELRMYKDRYETAVQDAERLSRDVEQAKRLEGQLRATLEELEDDLARAQSRERELRGALEHQRLEQDTEMESLQTDLALAKSREHELRGAIGNLKEEIERLQRQNAEQDQVYAENMAKVQADCAPKQPRPNPREKPQSQPTQSQRLREREMQWKY